ncbi:MAG: hypothetical protein U1C18_03065 [Patescibacteria group bacterium]|nr:hypothetical protein [bacterium]MDZ4221833.1 hypothetical protein [Patescibacteria group bacterium]
MRSWMPVVSLVLLAVCIDAFLGPGMALDVRFFSGFLGIAFFVRSGRFGRAYAFAAAYGLAMDILNPAFPFGVFLVTNICAWAGLVLARRSLAGADARRIAAVVFALLYAYALAVLLVQYTSLALFAPASSGLGVVVVLWRALSAALATAALAAAVLAAARGLSGRAKHWFFATHE